MVIRHLRPSHINIRPCVLTRASMATRSPTLHLVSWPGKLAVDGLRRLAFRAFQAITTPHVRRQDPFRAFRPQRHDTHHSGSGGTPSVPQSQAAQNSGTGTTPSPHPTAAGCLGAAASRRPAVLRVSNPLEASPSWGRPTADPPFPRLRPTPRSSRRFAGQ